MRYYYALSSASALLLSGCSVYTPMLGAAPETRGKGELEAIAAWSFTNRLDVGATYSPVPHLLVRAAASTKGSGRPAAANDSTTYAQTNQYELAVGTYWPLGKHWLVGGLAAFGQAHAQAQYEDDGTTLLRLGILQPQRHQFDARYRKYSGEAYVTYQPSPRISLGLAYRVVQLRLTDATDFGVPVQSAPILRSEPMFFLRVRPGLSELVQVQLAAGSSGTFGYSERTADRADPARQFKLGRGYLSLGLAFYPHVLWRKH